MFIILDNAESILDPQGTDGREIYGVVKELSRMDNVCLCITSRITTVPPDCKCLDVPTLSIDAAHSTFYRIYNKKDQSGRIDKIPAQLDFHPLSITLLATVAHQNKWDNNRLVKEWEWHQTGVLQTEHDESLAVTTELSLASPMFQQLGSEARMLLGVVAFFPQGVDEKNLDWLFPTIPNINRIFDKFCILSLTNRSNGFITMLAPLRDYLCPKDPKASTLLCATKDLYLARLSVPVAQDDPGFEETRWIIMEEVNVEHLLDVFMSADPTSSNIWKGCNDFMTHLYWHMPRKTVLGPKIEQLSDDHRWKPEGLIGLSRLFDSVGNYEESKRVLTDSLGIWREQGDDRTIARTLRLLAFANRTLCLYEEGVQQAKEALEVFERLGDKAYQTWCLIILAQLLLGDNQFDEAEEVIKRSINLADKGSKLQLCQSHRILGKISYSKGEIEKAISNYNEALGISSQFNWPDEMFWIHYSLATLFSGENEFDDAHTHIEQAKQYASYDKYYFCRAMELQARTWVRQGRLEDAASEASCAIENYGKLGAVKDLERCGDLLQHIERVVKEPSPDDSDSSGRHPLSQ